MATSSDGHRCGLLRPLPHEDGAQRRASASPPPSPSRQAEMQQLLRARAERERLVGEHRRRLEGWRGRARELRAEGGELPRRARIRFESHYAALRERLDDARLALARLEGARDEGSACAAARAGERAWASVLEAEQAVIRAIRKGRRGCGRRD